MFNILYSWSAPSWIFITLMGETAERNDSPTWPNSLHFMPSVDVLLRINFQIKDARGQCYDGAATMSGTKTGVATQFKSLNKDAFHSLLWTHLKPSY